MSLLLSTIRQTIPYQSLNFKIEDIPDQTGFVSVVTGGYGGIGEETVKALLFKNATVYILGRSHEKGKAAIQRLRQAVGQKGIVEFVMCDLNDLHSVRNCTEELKGKTDHIDSCYASGGVMFPPAGSLTETGVDLQFATNVLGHFHLVTLLLPLLLASPHKAQGYPRVMSTSSSGSYIFAPSEGVCFDSLKADPSTGKPQVQLSPQKLYGQSKLANIVFANELDRRYRSQGLVSSSGNPGNLNTDLPRHIGLGRIGNLIMKLVTYHASYGALSQLWAGTMPEGEGLHGKYWIPWARLGPMHPVGQDEQVGAKLWAWCEKECEGY